MRRTATMIMASVVLAGCPDDPLAEPRALEQRGATEAAGEAYLEAAKADPALLAAWDGAIRIFCQERADVGRCLAALDFELDLLGEVDRHADALAEALESRARARLEQGLVEPARSDLERAEKVAPQRASLHAAFARIHLALGERSQARARLRRARSLDPNLAELETLWALAHPPESASDVPAVDGAPPDGAAEAAPRPTNAGGPAPDPSESDLPAFGR